MSVSKSPLLLGECSFKLRSNERTGERLLLKGQAEHFTNIFHYRYTFL